MPARVLRLPSARRRVSRWSSALAVAAFVIGGAQAAEPPRPNIVLILADDLGWKDVGFHGSEIRTPNIDAIARSGATLDQFYVNPLCSPTRASLLTGRHPMRQGLQVGVVRPWADYGLPLDERTLPQALKQAGYATWIVGKWHLGRGDAALLPMARGFDHQYGCYNGAIDYFSHDRSGGLDWHRDQQPVREAGYSTDLIGAEAVRAIDTRDRAKPLFLYVPFNAPHAPLQSPDDLVAAYAAIPNKKRRTYAAMVTALDTQVGRIREAITRNRIERDTVVMFFSDNGGPMGPGADNGALHGGKGSLYDGGSRVPCCLSWPGRIPAGATVSALITVRDWYPTLLRLAGGSLAQPLPIDGADVWPCLVDNAASPNQVHLYNTSPQGGAVRTADWKLIRRTAGAAPASDAADEDSDSGSDPGPALELFHLRTDPNEARNVADSHPDIVADLTAKLQALAAQAVPPKNAPKPAGFRVPAVW
jgi:arylsulfatase A-like enzyme